MTIWQKIKLLFTLKDAYNKIKEAFIMNKGIKTTEFWLTLLTVLGSVAAAIAGFIPADLVLKVSGSVVAVYMVARAVVKATATTKDDEILSKIETILKNLGFKIPEEQPK